MKKLPVKRLVRACMVCLMAGLLSHAHIPVHAQGIRVGVLLPLTGRLSELGGETAYRAFQMAAEDINAAGGIHGEKIEILFEDTIGDRQIGLSAVEKLITQDNVVLLTGGFSSTVTWATSAFAQKREIPFLVSTASADRITEADREYVFRLNTPVSEQPNALASFLKRVTSVKTVAILHEQTILGESYSRKFRQICETWGLSVVMKEDYDVGAYDFRALLTEVKAKYPDLVYMISQTQDGALIMQQAREVDLNPKLFVGDPSGFGLHEFREQALETSTYVYAPVIWAPSLPYPDAKEFHNRFIIKYENPPDYHGAQAYAAMQIIARVLREAKSFTPEDIRDALAEIDMMTLLGPVKFVSYDRKTQQNRLPTYLVQWLDGGLRTVWPKQVATESYVYPTPTWDERF